MPAGFHGLGFEFGLLAASPGVDYGTCIYWIQDIGDIRKITFSWMAAPSGELMHWMTDELDGDLLLLETFPLDQPTDNYDIALIDRFGSDALNGLGANRDTVNAEATKLNVGTSASRYIFTEGLHKFVVTSAGGQREGVTILTMRRRT